MRPPALLDDGAQLLELSLRAEERAQLQKSDIPVNPVSIALAKDDTHPLLRELPCLLVLDIQICRRSTPADDIAKSGVRTLEFLNSSITRRSYGEKPATSRTTERTNLVRADWMPLRWLGRTAWAMGVVGWPLLRPWRRSSVPTAAENACIHGEHRTTGKRSFGKDTHCCEPFS